MLILEKITEKDALIIDDLNELTFNAPKELVEGCKIGDVIKFDGERYHTDEPKTAKRHELIKELEGKLF
ncbi:MAG: DUF3006 domain-containing protein [Oscillospiraceae bacterium]|nr:hypothetical protein [Oscillospiraceae bacterium]MBQ4487252.1 hypothetical protein [Oscillospiraceae bacterium]MCR5805621.1 DUF3006 domain-containing protein [Oscillospiraceae bacterium]